MSRFKILAERHDYSDTEKGSEEHKTQKETRAKETEATSGSDGEEGGEGDVEALLDEDGDLELTRRYGGKENSLKPGVVNAERRIKEDIFDTFTVISSID